MYGGLDTMGAGKPTAESSSTTCDSAAKPSKPLVLAASTRAMESELRLFCSSKCKTVQVFDFDIVSVDVLNDPESLPHSIDEYQAVVIAFREDEPVPEDLEQWLEQWASRRRGEGGQPLVICRRGLLMARSDEDETAIGVQQPLWTSLLERLQMDLDVSVVEDTRPIMPRRQ